MDAQVSVELADGGEDLQAGPLPLRVFGLPADVQVVARPRLHVLALVQAEHLLLVAFLEVINDEVAAVRDVLLLATQG